MTLLMGLYARLPFAVAPGMGLNAFFAYTIVLQQHLPWQAALGMVFWAGVLFLLVSGTPLRETIATSIPADLRLAAAGGHRAAADVHRVAQRRTDRRGSRDDCARRRDRSPGRALAGRAARSRWCCIGATTRLRFSLRSSSSPLAAWTLGYAQPPGAWSARRTSRRCSSSSISLAHCKLSLLPAIVSILFTDLFDSLSTFIGVADAADLTDGRPAAEPAPRAHRRCVCDAGRGTGRHLVGHGVRREHRRHPDGRSNRTRVGRDRAVLPAVFLHGAAGGSGAVLRDRAGADPRRTVDVSE